MFGKGGGGASGEAGRPFPKEEGDWEVTLSLEAEVEGV